MTCDLSLTGSRKAALRSFSAESLLSTDESIELEENLNKRKRSRPLSMVVLPGSLDSTESMSPVDDNKSQWSPNYQLEHSASSKEILRTINEDIIKIRERKAHRSDSSPDTSLERTFPHQSTPNSSQAQVNDSSEQEVIILPAENETVNLTAELPSRSICVDSGLPMEEGNFCESDLLAPVTKSSANDSKRECKSEASLPAMPENQNLCTNDEACQSSVSGGGNISVESKTSASTESALSEGNEKQQLDADTADAPKVAAEEAGIFVKAKLITIKPDSSTPLVDTINPTPKLSEEDNMIESNGVAVKGDSTLQTLDNKELVDQPLESVLSSQSVSLRAKLQRLSTFYDDDDGEDLKLKKEEPSGPYEIFKAPKKNSHARSR